MFENSTMRRLTIALVVCVAALRAQSITITAPAANQVVTGYTGFSFAVTLSGAPSVARVCFVVDAYSATNPGDVYTWGTNLGGLAYSGCSTAAPYSLRWNSFWTLNGPRQVLATAFDALGNTVATSPAVAFTVANSWPCAWTPALSVSTGTALSSNWSGQVSLQGTVTGSGAADNLTFGFYIDGISQYIASNITAGTATGIVDTTQFPNGSHVVALVVNDTSGCTTYSDGTYVGGAAEWSRTVTFANGAAAMEVRNDAHDIYMSTGGTHTITPSLINTDGSIASNLAFYFYTPSATCSLSSSSGSSSTITAGSSAASCPIEVMTPTASATDGAPYSGILSFLASSTYTWKTSDVGRMVVISGGTGCIAGSYLVGAVSLATNAGIMGNFTNGQTTNYASSSGASGCHFTLGPTRTTWALISPSNILPHFGTDGAIHTSYDPVHSFFMNEAFNSIDGFTDQPYNVTGCGVPFGFGCDFQNGGFNTVEAGISNNDMSGSAGQASFTSSQSSYLTQLSQTVASCPKCVLFGTGDNLDRDPQSLFYLTRGTPSPLGTWSQTGVNIIFSSLKSFSRTWVGVSWMDEINNWGQNPLQGPIHPGTGTIQNWLTSITASGGTCTALATTTTPGGQYTMFGPAFTISGSSTANMNSTAGNGYTFTAVDSTHFTFPCPGVANGTYNSSTDPGLTVQALDAGAWYSGVSGQDYIHYDGWASMVNQANSVAGRTPVAGSQAAQTNITAVAEWEGNSNQSISTGGNTVSNISDWADIYWSHGISENYLAARSSTNSLATDSVQRSTGPEEGYWLRSLYGTYNPSKPLTTITQGTSANYGFEAPAVSVTSTSGNLFTFSSPHGLNTIYPGSTRMWCSGTSNSAYNTNFYIIDAPTPTTVHAALAQMDFSAAVSGGTATFQNGDTLAISSAVANNAIVEYGLPVVYAGGSDNNVNRHRGQTITFSGTGNSTFNSRTFFYTPENFLLATDGNGTPNSTINIRELPTGSSTGGSCNVLPDNNFIKGRSGDYADFNNASAGHSASPAMTTASIVEAAIVRAAGHRLYKFSDSMQGYVNQVVGSPSNFPWIHAGWTGLFSQSNIVIFNQNTVGSQLFSHPKYENGFSVPMWHLASVMSLLLSRLSPLLLQPALNSPDYGFTIDCGARSGPNGSLLLCANFSEGPETRTFSLAAYKNGNPMTRYFVHEGAVTVTSLSGTASSDTVTLLPEDTVFYTFPSGSSSFAIQPIISAQLADVPNASKIAVRYGYDQYLLDAGTGNVVDCGTGTCSIPIDRGAGTVYYRLIYLSSNSTVLATSDIQTL
jgi:hypothetical protein